MNEQTVEVSRPVIPTIVAQHAEEAVLLWERRAALADAPHCRLLHLGRFDERLAAHLDGLAVAGAEGVRFAMQQLANVGPGEVFAAAVRAIEDKDLARFDQLFALAAAVTPAQRGLVSAFGWVSSNHLAGTVKHLLEAADPLRRAVGLAACSMHAADPGTALDAALRDPDSALRARALRVTGELGKVDRLPVVRAQLKSPVAQCRFWAAWSAVLLGDRKEGLEALLAFGREPGAARRRALLVGLAAMAVGPAHEWLRNFAAQPIDRRLLIFGSGIVGDPQYVPWLIGFMGDVKLKRLAGEAFSMITGADLAALQLDHPPISDAEAGPNDDPEDPNVEMDPDADLAWPDAAKVKRWWDTNASRFATGVRAFAGAPVTPEQCRHVLEDGTQRQRHLAAVHRVLLQPGLRLFNVRAPTRRQRRLLASL